MVFSLPYSFAVNSVCTTSHINKTCSGWCFAGRSPPQKKIVELCTFFQLRNSETEAGSKMLRKARFCPFSTREYDFAKASLSAITINLFLLIVCLNLHSPHPKGENFLTKEIILQSDSEYLGLLCIL